MPTEDPIAESAAYVMSLHVEVLTAVGLIASGDRLEGYLTAHNLMNVPGASRLIMSNIALLVGAAEEIHKLTGESYEDIVLRWADKIKEAMDKAETLVRTDVSRQEKGGLN